MSAAPSPVARRRRARTGALLLAASLVLVACGDDSTDADSVAADNPVESTADGTPIVLGNIVDLTGPVPGLFEGARQAMEAFVAKTNSEGGVDGRPLELLTGDSKIDCNATRSAYEDLAPKIEAFVGNVSALDGCTADVLPKFPKLPAVFQQLDPSLADIATVLTPSPRPPGTSIGPYQWISDQNPGAIKKLGILVNTRSKFSSDQLLSGLRSIGGEVAFTREVQIDVQTDYTADIIKMRSAGVEWLSMDGFNIETIVRILRDAKQQNWRPQVITSAPAYDGNFFDLVDPAAAEGIMIPLSTAMFLGEDREASQGVDDYLTWLERVHPGAKADLFGANAWAAGELYLQARKAAGRDAAPEDVVQALIAIKEFDANGMIATSNPGDQEPSTCYLIATVKDGAFERVFPDSGFSCEGAEYVPFSG